MLKKPSMSCVDAPQHQVFDDLAAKILDIPGDRAAQTLCAPAN